MKYYFDKISVYTYYIPNNFKLGGAWKLYPEPKIWIVQSLCHGCNLSLFAMVEVLIDEYLFFGSFWRGFMQLSNPSYSEITS